MWKKINELIAAGKLLSLFSIFYIEAGLMPKSCRSNCHSIILLPSFKLYRAELNWKNIINLIWTKLVLFEARNQFEFGKEEMNEVGRLRE